MSTDELPLYVSRRSFRSLGQQYRIYTDRVELGFFGFKKTIAGADILDGEVRPRTVIGDLFRGKGLAAAFALKLDLATCSGTLPFIDGPSGSGTSASRRTTRTRSCKSANPS